MVIIISVLIGYSIANEAINDRPILIGVAKAYQVRQVIKALEKLNDDG